MPSSNSTTSVELKQYFIFNEEGERFGIPSRFVFSIPVAGIALYQVIGWVALMVVLVLFKVVYQIHRDDPKALEIWQESLRDPRCWVLCKVKKRRIIFL